MAELMTPGLRSRRRTHTLACARSLFLHPDEGNLLGSTLSPIAAQESKFRTVSKRRAGRKLMNQRRRTASNAIQRHLTQRLATALGAVLILFGCGDTGTGPDIVPPPPQATLQSVIIGGTLSLEEGSQSQLSVTANYSDGRTRDVTNQASYRSSDDAIATVSAAGVLTGVRRGRATITANYSENGSNRQDAKDASVDREIPRFRTSVNVSSIRILNDCDAGPIIQAGPGEFTYRVSTRFPGDSGVTTLAERTNRISRSNGQSISVGRSRSTEVSTSTSSVSVEYRLTEWDASAADSRMNNRRGARTHRLSNGQWTGTGSNSVTVGSGSCRAQLNYTFTAQRLN